MSTLKIWANLICRRSTPFSLFRDSKNIMSISSYMSALFFMRQIIETETTLYVCECYYPYCVYQRERRRTILTRGQKCVCTTIRCEINRMKPFQFTYKAIDVLQNSYRYSFCVFWTGRDQIENVYYNTSF